MTWMRDDEFAPGWRHDDIDAMVDSGEVSQSAADALKALVIALHAEGRRPCMTRRRPPLRPPLPPCQMTWRIDW